MIKSLKEWRRSAGRLLDDDLPLEERNNIHNEMDEFESKHPDLFRKLSEAKWSADGLVIIPPD